MLETIKNYIFGEWRVISQAPVSFAMAVLATAVVIWFALSWAYGNIVSHQASEIKLLERLKGEASARPTGQLAGSAELRLHIYGDTRTGDGFHAWTEEEIAQFEGHHPIGSRERLALALGLHTGQRRGDVVRMGRQHIRGDVLHVKQEKTGAVLAIPLHPELAAILATVPSTQLTFLMTLRGKPFTAHAFTAWFAKACDDAGLPSACTFHGLRKAACRRLAEAGCTVHEIGAISGHATLREVERYTKAVDQAKLARAAMERAAMTQKKREAS